MKGHKYRRMFFRFVKTTGAIKIFISYLILFFIAAGLLTIIEPGIVNYVDGLWFSFAVLSTVGFGDVTAATVLGRIITVVLSIFSIAVVAIFTAVITSFFMNIAKAKARDSAAQIIDDLTHLPELSKEELQEVSDKVKRFLDKNN